jgi:plasmid maintenance system antidote protein VapI
MTVFSKAIGIHNQNLHNFRKGKRGLTEEKTVLLEKVIVLKYGRLLMLEDGDYEVLSK